MGVLAGAGNGTSRMSHAWAAAVAPSADACHCAPTAHLDPVTAAEILVTIETLMADRTVVLVSHGLTWSGPVDQVIALNQGKLVATVTP